MASINSTADIKIPTELNTPEFRLLAACAYFDEARWGEQAHKVKNALGDNPSGDVFKALVARHRLPVLAATVLTRYAKETSSDLSALIGNQIATFTKLRNLSFHAELVQLQKTFSSQKISVLPLKGTMLSDHLYGVVWMRQVKDIDLIIHPSDLASAMQLLEEQGYQVELPLALRTEAHLNLVRKIWWHVECYHPTKKIQVELHWRFERFSKSSLNQCWWEGFSAEDQKTRDYYEVLFLCLHGASHGWSRLKWLGDVQLILNNLENDQWDVLLKISSQLNMDLILSQTLILLGNIFHAVFPESVNAHLSKRHKEAILLVNNAFTYLNSPQTTYGANFLSRITLLRAYITLTSQMGHRYSLLENGVFWLRLISFHEKDICRYQLPNYLHWLYPLIRPFSLLNRWAIRN